MTLDEAKIIGDIVAWADGGCSSCVRELVDELNDRFPDFIWSVENLNDVHVTAAST